MLFTGSLYKIQHTWRFGSDLDDGVKVSGSVVRVDDEHPEEPVARASAGPGGAATDHGEEILAPDLKKKSRI